MKDDPMAPIQTVRGSTRMLVIVGDPIAQARSPEVLNAMLARRGCDAALVPWQAHEEDLDVVMRGLMRTVNLRGIIVTYPHKQAALAFADDILPRARQVGATNAMRRGDGGRWIADMFDGVGLVEALAAANVPVAGRRIKLIGAGGAGSAIAFALAAAGAAGIGIAELDDAKAEALAAAVGEAHPGCDVRRGRARLEGEDILVNATTVGLRAEDGPPIPLDGLASRPTVVDIAPRREGTRLLEEAQALGCRTIAGGAMVEGQAAALLAFFGFPD